jgi:hypothetical protein
MKDKLKLIDSSFSHSILGYCSDYQLSEFFYWDRTHFIDSDILVITDYHITENYPLNQNKIAWLIESMCISPSTYQFIENNYSKFDFILTHEKIILDNIPNSIFIPFGGCWIETDKQKIEKKTKDISIVVSDKRVTDGHNLRHEIISKFKKDIDVFGRGYNPILNKVDSLLEYKFSIVIENCKRDYWFTEKLIDCFVTGTIPIYWGCPSIGDFFDINGIIVIENINDLTDIISNCNEELYNSMYENILNNFNTSKKYLLPDDWVYFFMKKKY